jgi:hypothetical protein
MRMCMYVAMFRCMDMYLGASLHIYIPTYMYTYIYIYILNKHTLMQHIGFHCKTNGKQICNMQVCLKRLTGTKKTTKTKQKQYSGGLTGGGRRDPQNIVFFVCFVFFGPGHVF